MAGVLAGHSPDLLAARVDDSLQTIRGLGDAGRAVFAARQDEVAVEQTRMVPAMRIDTLARHLAPPTVLKIDVEGAEADVLEGGEATISRHRPTILIEGPRELWAPMQAFS